MKSFFFFAIIFLFRLICFSQINIDSLQKVVVNGKYYNGRMQCALILLKYYETNNFDSAIIIGNKAIGIARQNIDSISIAQIKVHIGIAYYLKGDYNIAAKYFYESINILQRNNDKKNLAPAYNELAKLYRKMKNYIKAIENYDKANSIYKSLQDTSGEAMILNESGVVYEYLENYKEALHRYRASLNLAKHIGDSLSVSYSLSNIAGIYIVQKNYSGAEEYLLRALRIRQQLKDSFSIAITYSDLGTAMTKKGDLVKAVKYFVESNRLASRLKYIELESNNYNELSNIEKKKGNYLKALDYFSKSKELNDLLYTVEKNKEIETLNAQYENAQKEQKILEQENRITLLKYLFSSTSILVLFIIILIVLLYKRYKLKEKNEIQAIIIKQQEKAALAVVEAEENERKRIGSDLHDGIGQMMSSAMMNLSAIETEIFFTDNRYREQFNKVIKLVSESCKEIRTISHNMMPNAIFEAGFTNAVRTFLYNVENTSLTVNSYFNLHDDSIDRNTKAILYRVIQELVNNVVKHAEATQLDISIVQEDEIINVIIEDNGKGFSFNELENNDGIGLKNIQSRIAFLRGNVEWDSRINNGTVVSIHVPYTKKY